MGVAKIRFQELSSRSRSVPTNGGIFFHNHHYWSEHHYLHPPPKQWLQTHGGPQADERLRTWKNHTNMCPGFMGHCGISFTLSNFL